MRTAGLLFEYRAAAADGGGRMRTAGLLFEYRVAAADVGGLMRTAGLHRVRRLSYSRLASLRSSHAMRLYSCPGLRRRNAGWKVGINTAEP